MSCNVAFHYLFSRFKHIYVHMRVFWKMKKKLQVLLRVLLSCLFLGEAKSYQCIGEKYDHQVTFEGCRTKTVRNLYCGGTCQSYFIPNLNKNGFSCSACRPTETNTVAVTLSCKGNIFISLNVTVFQNCQCTEMKCKIDDILSPDVLAQLSIKTSSKIHPCRMKCRKCQKAKEKYDRALKEKLQTEYMMISCRTQSCKMHNRTSIQKSTFDKVKVGKKEKRHHCRKCSNCKYQSKMGK